MNSIPDRRTFLWTGATSLSALTMSGAADSPTRKIHMGILGLHGRGKDLLRKFTAWDDVEIAYLCDPDSRVFPAALKALPERHKRQPKCVADLREVLADRNVDAVVVATPDHWHALATVWACQAGKHVYVEKPVSHNLIEGRRMVEAARKHRRVVQVGTQRRSAVFLQEARDYIRSGKLGKIPFARTWIAGPRPNIGRKADGKIPEGVNYDLWLGPASRRLFNPNRFHYTWHWFWDYGTGELGNNGIHGLDVIRMLLGLDAPHRVSSSGGKLFYDDDQETPDTQIVAFDFANCTVVWEHRTWEKAAGRKRPFGVEIIGEKGTLIVDDAGWHLENGPESLSVKATPTDGPHQRNFLDCVVSGKTPAGDIEEGHRSTRLCHLGNIAQRLGRSLRFSGEDESIVDDAEASKLLGRSYSEGFVLPREV